MKQGYIWLILVFCATCSPEASHTPNPLLLPGQGISNSIQNARYNARRAKVSEFVHKNHASLLQDIAMNGGSYLTQAQNLARVPMDDQGALAHQLHADLALYRTNTEALVVALMVHGS